MSSNENHKVRWTFFGVIIGAAITAAGQIVAAYVAKDDSSDVEQCVSEYAPSNSRAIEAEAFLEYSSAKLNSEWDFQNAVRTLVAQGMSKEDAEVEMRAVYSELLQRPSEIKTFIEDNPKISLADLQAVNRAFASDCMKAYPRILKLIYDHERHE